MLSCVHCGSAVAAEAASDGPVFCCQGCRGAYGLLRGLGLDQYYRRRSIDPSQPPLKPDDMAGVVDYQAHVVTGEDGHPVL
ncbi:MAG TPA: hypothetical protein HPQ04_07575, partial [Rhodospirillaceae bacterium]|nr:hypothetical protein [Rhodospirillaceae bacterium]